MNDLIGKPFQWQGRGPNAYDCWGLTLEVMSRLGINCDYVLSFGKMDFEVINEYIENSRASPKWQEVSHPKKGDVLICGTSRQWAHVCPFVDESSVLHITKGQAGVIRLDPRVLYRLGYKKQKVLRWLG